MKWAIDYKWSELKNLLENTLENISEEPTDNAVNVLIDSIYWAVREKDIEKIPSDLFQWVLDQLLRVHDFDKLGRV